jgi:DNA-binding PadR family transcriptional regulator
MSVVRLFVLGIVRSHGRAHGYAVHRELADWRIDTWTLVRPGSIYHALRQLSGEGMLREVGIESGVRGPGRTTYELTEAGGSAFISLLEAALVSVRPEELGAGVAFMQELPRARVLELLREQHRRASDARAGLSSMRDRFPDRDRPPHTADLLDLWAGSLGATATWIASLIARLDAGEYTMADDPP